MNHLTVRKLGKPYAYFYVYYALRTSDLGEVLVFPQENVIGGIPQLLK